MRGIRVETMVSSFQIDTDYHSVYPWTMSAGALTAAFRISTTIQIFISTLDDM